MESENKVHIRWPINGDKDEIIEIENAVFEFSWSLDDLNKALSQKNCFGMVAEHNCKRIVGYFVCELIHNMIHVLNFAVHEKFQGQGIGKQMVDELIGRLTVSRRSRIRCEIRETNLMAQVFFHQRGFRVVKILKNPWNECSDDLIRMVYRNSGPEEMIPFDRVQRPNEAEGEREMNASLAQNKKGLVQGCSISLKSRGLRRTLDTARSPMSGTRFIGSWRHL